MVLAPQEQLAAKAAEAHGAGQMADAARMAATVVVARAEAARAEAEVFTTNAFTVALDASTLLGSYVRADLTRPRSCFEAFLGRSTAALLRLPRRATTPGYALAPNSGKRR